MSVNIFAPKSRIGNSDCRDGETYSEVHANHRVIGIGIGCYTCDTPSVANSVTINGNGSQPEAISCDRASLSH